MIKISFIIPTLNAESVLEKCLQSIGQQKFNKDNYEIIIADGGSTDKTIEIAKKYNSIIVKNPLKTAEAGKAVGLKKSKGEYIALIDSDNILPNKNWINEAIFSLEKDFSIIGSEPWMFTYRPNSGYMERYSALIGANDPYAFITGVYDRKNYINNKWTGLKIKTEDFPKYLKIKLEPNQKIPTIGANGTVFRTSFLKDNFSSNYFFDIDIIVKLSKKQINLYILPKLKIVLFILTANHLFSNL
jgi:glycosyltransferase involved in cell wall biosynthesis